MTTVSPKVVPEIPLEDPAPTDVGEAPPRPQRPDYLPEKFWDDAQGVARLDALARSYGELERKLGEQRRDIPDSPENYHLSLPDQSLHLDPEVNQRLHEAGFTHQQAQLVYDLAFEVLAPMVEQFSGDLSHEHEHKRLCDHFGGENRWQHMADQLRTWGKANLPPPVFDSLCCSFDGVLALQRLMESQEPRLGSGPGTAPSSLQASDLRSLMTSPRYWRDQDPDVVAKVRSGFAELYPEGT